MYKRNLPYWQASREIKNVGFLEIATTTVLISQPASQTTSHPH
jgi:hypothetical protein